MCDQQTRVSHGSAESEIISLDASRLKMHVSVSDPSKKMMMDLISSANNFCIVFGICGYVGKINEMDFGSRQNAASVVLTPNVSETFTLSE